MTTISKDAFAISTNVTYRCQEKGKTTRLLRRVRLLERTIQIGGISGDFGGLCLEADDSLGVPVGVAHCNY